MILEPGQFVTGIREAIKELRGISYQSYRTAIKYLCATERITIKPTNKFTIITIQNWEKYQETNTLSNNQITHKEHTNNKQITTYKNVKKEKKEENIILGDENVGPSPKQEMEAFLKDQEAIISWLVESRKVTKELARYEVDKFIGYWTEPDLNGKRQKWQKQDTFELKRRLTKWFNNNYPDNNRPAEVIRL